ncbi:MAG: MFS transporter [Novosphingobium sp.]
MAETDPRQVMNEGAMSVRQWLAVVITVLLNALDGFDVLSSAFAGPGIKQEWHLAPDGLGAVLSMELIGMGVGSLLLGGVADKLGRRPTILVCLALMASGMFLASTANSPQTLSMWRVLTGLGIGGMLAATNAVVHEVSNRKSRSFAVALMVIGYPLGAFFGGLVAAELLRIHSWRSVFVFGGIMTSILFPLVVAFVPETPAWLNQMRPARALERINSTLTRFRLAPIAALGPPLPHEAEASLSDILKPAYRRATLMLSVGYAAHALTFYYILKLAPSIIADPQFAGQHFTRAQGAGVLAYANLGGAIGGACFSWFMHRFGIRRATMIALGLSVLAVIHFGLGQSSLQGWTIAVMITGLTTNAAVVGFYAAFAASYPTHAKATGTGFALSVGRGGAALSPYLAGLLFAGQVGLMTTSVIMAMGSLLALALFAFLPLPKGH